MNPAKGIAPPASNNECLRRILGQFIDANGNPLPGVPNGPLAGTHTKVTRVTVVPNLVRLLVPARVDRRSAFIANLDDNDTFWVDSSPNVNQDTGTTLPAGRSLPYNWAGPVYVFSLTGNPTAEFTEFYG